MIQTNIHTTPYFFIISLSSHATTTLFDDVKYAHLWECYLEMLKVTLPRADGTTLNTTSVIDAAMGAIATNHAAIFHGLHKAHEINSHWATTVTWYGGQVGIAFATGGISLVATVIAEVAKFFIGKGLEVGALVRSCFFFFFVLVSGLLMDG
jgi:hypothetical protein